MAATQLSTSPKKLVVWGNKIGVAYTSGSVAAGDNIPKTSSFTKDGDEAELRNTEGEVVTWIGYNKFETLDIEVVPVGDDLTAAGAANICPEKGEKVTITDLTSATSAEHSELASTDWICMSASQSSSDTDMTKISMSLKKYTLPLS